MLNYQNIDDVVVNVVVKCHFYMRLLIDWYDTRASTQYVGLG